MENISSYFNFALLYAFFFHLGISLEKNSEVCSTFTPVTCNTCPNVGHKPPFLCWPLLRRCVVTLELCNSHGTAESVNVWFCS